MSATHHRTPGRDAEAPPSIVADLVRRFGDHIDAYKSGRYNETQLRREFIDPLFRALGWDVDNEQGYAEAYKDVIHEAAVQIEGAVKAPDYSFRIGGVRKFFLEAKKPSINIKGDPAPAYQLRRYAWSAKLPLSILTDFEEFAVYDCRTRPVKTDSPATARVLYLKYTDYLDRWSDIASVFSREAILTGSFDKYVESKKKKRGTAEVDAAFLQEIEAWRETLARNIALRNADLTQRQLNDAVQVTIDRIIFLRMCEDRGIEDYGRLMALLNGDRVYDRLMQLFREADQRYNSGLFHFQRERGRGDPDTLTPDLTIDDRILKDIIKGLYYPDSPYEFSVLPADILGHVYEQFLGKVIRLTPGHRAKVEEKPEVRKAGGVYYTPTYIVEYIVKHTVGQLLGQAGPERSEGPGSPRTVKWITREKGKPVHQPRLDKPLRVLDPACGSGSFLLGAYQYLLDWYLDYYTAHDPESWARKRNPPIYLRGALQPSRPVSGRTAAARRGSDPDYRLTVAERKRILLEHIFGVDIDPQAVEVTKLSLLLKVLEGETAHSLGTHLWYEKERALPDLATNIKCGNSLIGPDFYNTSGRQMDMFDEEERLRINVFDWPAEFPHIFKRAAASPRAATPARRKTPAPSKSTPAPSPGFDAVIGNPPYIRMEAFKELKPYLAANYATHSDRADIFYYFLERAIWLSREDGFLGYIISNSFTRSRAGKKLRSFLSDNLDILKLVEFGDFTPFVAAAVYPLILVGRKSRSTRTRIALSVQEEEPTALPGQTSFPVIFTIDQADLSEEEWVFEEPASRALRAKLLSDFPSLRDLYGPARMGIKTGLNEAFIINDAQRNDMLSMNPEASSIIKPYVSGEDLDNWSYRWRHTWLIYTPHGIDMTRFPGVLEYLSRFKRKLAKRATKQKWYELQQPQQGYAELMAGPKIMYPDMSRYPKFNLDRQAMFFSNTVYFIRSDSFLLLGLLNSRLLWFVIRGLSNALRGGLWRFRLFSGHIERLPMARVDLSKRSAKAHHDRMVRLVQQMLDLHKQLAAAKTAHEKTAIQRQIDATDRQIDQLVYDLYGLTDDEIRIVEDATK